MLNSRFLTQKYDGEDEKYFDDAVGDISALERSTSLVEPWPNRNSIRKDMGLFFYIHNRKIYPSRDIKQSSQYTNILMKQFVGNMYYVIYVSVRVCE